MGNRLFASIQEISIHAPTRGATGMQIYILQYDKISIHAPTRGATHLSF